MAELATIRRFGVRSLLEVLTRVHGLIFRDALMPVDYARAHYTGGEVVGQGRLEDPQPTGGLCVIARIIPGVRRRCWRRRGVTDERTLSPSGFVSARAEIRAADDDAGPRASAESAPQELENVARPVPDQTAPTEQVRRWLESISLSDRDRGILCARVGLRNGETKTLEEIARLAGITRERVRQVEKRAFRLLRHSPQEPLIEPMLLGLRRLLHECGGLASEARVAEFVGELLADSNYNPTGVARLLMSVFADFVPVKEVGAWALADPPAHLALRTMDEAYQILLASQAPVERSVMLRRLKESTWYKELTVVPDDAFLFACIPLSVGIVVRDDGTFGLERWERRILGDMVIALDTSVDLRTTRRSLSQDSAGGEL